MSLWALVGGGRRVDAGGFGLGPMGCWWSAVVCSPADAANKPNLVMLKSRSRASVMLYSSSPECITTVSAVATGVLFDALLLLLTKQSLTTLLAVRLSKLLHNS